MKTLSRESSAFLEIRRQKAEALKNIRREQEIMRICTDALVGPLKNKNLKPRTPMQSFVQSVSKAGYMFRLVKGAISIFKVLH